MLFADRVPDIVISFEYLVSLIVFQLLASDARFVKVASLQEEKSQIADFELSLINNVYVAIAPFSAVTVKVTVAGNAVGNVILLTLALLSFAVAIIDETVALSSSMTL